MPDPGRPRLVRLDLHVHSSASFDCEVPPLEVARRAAALGLSPVVLTDHGTIEGARALQEAGVECIAGEEILTRDGELIGLFLSEAVPDGLDAVETAAAIQEQGGLVYLQHPYDRRRRALREEAIEKIAGAIDIVEVANGRSDAEANRLAADLRDTLGVPAGAGSDAHALAELGRCHVVLGEFKGAAEFLARMQEAEVVTGTGQAALRARRLLGRLAGR